MLSGNLVNIGFVKRRTRGLARMLAGDGGLLLAAESTGAAFANKRVVTLFEF